MENENDLRIEAVFDSANYGKVACKIKITEGVALAVFSDVRLARDMYFAEKKLGIDDVYLKERVSAMATKYPGKNQKQIAKILTDKLNAHNITVTKEAGK